MQIIGWTERTNEDNNHRGEWAQVSSGLTTEARWLTTEASGLTTDASGLTTEASGLTTEASGLTTEASGLTTEASGINRLWLFKPNMWANRTQAATNSTKTLSWRGNHIVTNIGSINASATMYTESTFRP